MKRGFEQDDLNILLEKIKDCSWESLLNPERKKREKNPGRITFVLDFHPALFGIGSIVNAMWLVLQSSEDIKRIFLEKPIVA